PTLMLNPGRCLSGIDPGIVDKNIEPAELPRSFRHGGPRDTAKANVTGHIMNLAVMAHDLACCSGGCLSVHIDNRDSAPPVDEQAGNCTAKAACPACDD